MRRRGSASIAANPVLIGAVTTLVVLVAVFLAYNANSGLPFVPTYEVKAQVPNAAGLVVGNDVRIGGTRVGAVTDIAPQAQRDGAVTALLTMKLETSIKPLPVDSTVLIRSRSALGLKYVQITRGVSSRGYADGATIPLTQAKPHPVELDQVLNTFDTPTRRAAQVNLFEFGNALTGRGQDLNLFFQDLNPLLNGLQPVMRNLSSPATGLRPFVQSLGRTASIVAPAAETQAALFRNLDTTFSALASVARPYLQESISGGPAALDTAIRELPQLRPFLVNSAALFHELRPSAQLLATSSGDLAHAFKIGVGTLQRSPAFNARLIPFFQTVQSFATDPLVSLGVQDLTSTAQTLGPTLAFLTPAQTVCNYVSLFFRNISSLLSVGDNHGTTQRFIIIAMPAGPNNEGAPSSAPANGPERDNFLHINPYPFTASPGQPRECEAGNEPYIVGKQVIGNPPGNQGTLHDTTPEKAR